MPRQWPQTMDEHTIAISTGYPRVNVWEGWRRHLERWLERRALTTLSPMTPEWLEDLTLAERQLRLR
jgi:hypothetical protein